MTKFARVSAFYGAVFFTVLALFLGAQSSDAQLRDVPGSFADLVDRTSPSVVNIFTTQLARGSDSPLGQLNPEDLPEEFEQFREFFERFGREGQRELRVTSLGSGFIIDPSGYIVTNNHLIEDATEIKAKLSDGRELAATIIGRDRRSDLALLKIESAEALPYVSWGDSEAMRVGDWVIAIGNPFGLGGTVTAGIISAAKRDINAGPYDNFLQTDASINRGNSGGPMFNMKGEVIGVNTAIFSPTRTGGSVGIGFAVPAETARPIIEQLRATGAVQRGWLGVRIQSVTPELAEGLGLPDEKGALVGQVLSGGPAEKAGLESGDVILEFDGKTINEVRNLPLVVSQTPVGKQVDAVVWRRGAKRTFKVEVGELKEEELAAQVGGPASPGSGSQQASSELGLTLAPLNEELRERFALGEGVTGVVVTEVQATGPAHGAGLRPGDVIAEVNQAEVSSPEDVTAQVQATKEKGGTVVTLLLNRSGALQWVAVKLS